MAKFRQCLAAATLLVAGCSIASTPVALAGQADVHWTVPGWYLVAVEDMFDTGPFLYKGPFQTQDQCLAEKNGDPVVSDDPSAVCTYYSSKPAIDN